MRKLRLDSKGGVISTRQRGTCSHGRLHGCRSSWTNRIRHRTRARLLQTQPCNTWWTTRVWKTIEQTDWPQNLQYRFASKNRSNQFLQVVNTKVDTNHTPANESNPKGPKQGEFYRPNFQTKNGRVSSTRGHCWPNLLQLKTHFRLPHGLLLRLCVCTLKLSAWPCA